MHLLCKSFSNYISMRIIALAYFREVTNQRPVTYMLLCDCKKRNATISIYVYCWNSFPLPIQIVTKRYNVLLGLYSQHCVLEINIEFYDIFERYILKKSLLLARIFDWNCFSRKAKKRLCALEKTVWKNIFLILEG